MFWRVTIVTLLAVVAIGSVYWLIPAEDRDASKSINYVELYRSLKPKAEQGDAKAQFEIAKLYRTGQGAAQNIQTALYWYRKAAANGVIQAQYELGLIFDKGEGVRPDPVRAVRWYQLAYRQGRMREAALAMGMMFYRGRGVLKDVSEAIAWFRRAANLGHHCAQFFMGGVYEEGWAVNRDPVEAYKWYTVAIPGRDMCLKMERTYDPIAARERLAKRMTEFDIKKGEERAAAWRPSR